MVKGWEKVKLGDISEVCMCKRVFAEQTRKMGDIPFYKIGTFGVKADAYITSAMFEEYRKKYSFPQTGDVMLSAAGTLGRTVVYDGKPAYFQDSNIVWLKIDGKKICNDYLKHYYQVIAWVAPEGSTISRLYNSIIRATFIILPPLPEQRRIAEVLSDVDSLIVSLEKLIAKKKAIKQGAMQELLTGNKRLPGFTSEWVEKTFGDICPEILKGQSLSSGKFVMGNIPVIAGGKIPAGYHNRANRSGKTITISASGASAGYVAIHDYPIFATDCSTIGENTFYDIDYLYYLLLSNQEEIYKRQTGGAQPHIHSKDIKPLFCKVPQTKDEQTAIANILSDMDSEIAELEQKLLKYRNIKTGMMQTLLTGKIRLPEEKIIENAAIAKQDDNATVKTKKPHNRQFDDAVV